MKLRSRITNDSGKEKTNNVKNVLIKENTTENVQGDDNFCNKRKRLHEDRSKRHVLGERESKLARSKEQQTDVYSKPKSSKYCWQTEGRNSTKRKRISSVSSSNDHKKLKLALDMNDVDKVQECPIEKKLKTTEDLYGFLFSNTIKKDAEGVFDEDRLHTLLEKEKYLPTSSIADCSPASTEVDLNSRSYYQYVIVGFAMDKFHFRSETGLLAMTIFDDCWRLNLVNSNNYSLMILASVYIAAKYEETELPAIDDFSKYVFPSHTIDDITKTEIFILNAINFNLVRPLSIEISRYFALNLAYPEKGNFILDYICFVVAADNKTAHLKPSTIASCAVIIACELFNISPGNNRILLMKEITKDNLCKVLPLICEVVIDYVQLFTNGGRNKTYNIINIIFDKKRYGKLTSYFYSKLPKLLGFYEDLTEKSEK
ncbi:Cyclin, N-terminal domain and Cyclin-like domain-containing protein [Strongyloides ratti]|uniref:Cyclin, N-terminal domain and Cyclin-like domain-containing protein n=1 Tax=Strongyloides ratti TaxID=34506 RepID=A0A090MYP4_STRRB|nr:Cyclin, N-terminal domain and Cyclin-like domain-containing protein [Strongyloides ratti]CEF67539.1 Cyclin, N-terminal domain and Cyclin-like domain-containing protein [Strongyloides ratti]